MSSNLCCEKCNREFSSLKGLRIHMKHVHAIQNIDVKCHICDRLFKTSNGLAVHVKNHDPASRERRRIATKTYASQPEVRKQRSLSAIKQHANPEKRAARQAYYSSDEFRRTIDEVNARPDVKKRRSDAQKQVYIDDPTRREKVGNRIKLLWLNEDYHKKMIEMMATPEMKEKRSNAQKEAQNRPDVREKRVASVNAAYSDVEKKKHHADATRVANSKPEKRAKISAKMKQYFVDNPEKLEAFLKTSRSGCRLSKLHQKMRSLIGMDELGFVPEQHVKSKIVDELNEEKKVIVEFYGDHVHATPLRFKPDDIVKGFGYSASEKWDVDRRRVLELEKMGYNVIIVWSYDDVDLARQKIITALKRAQS